MPMPIIRYASDNEVIAMLERYQCPTPFHQVRTLFLGCLASPVESDWQGEIFEYVWKGTPPEFEFSKDEDESTEMILIGFWNRLADHQDEHNPFHLMRLDVKPTRASIQHLTQVRLQELDGFFRGLFGYEDALDLPESASDALDTLTEIESILVAMLPLLKDLGKPASPASMKELVSKCEQLTIIADVRINQVVLACQEARIHSKASSEPRTLH